MTKYDEAVKARQIADEIRAGKVEFRVGVETGDGENWPVLVADLGDSAIFEERAVLGFVARVLNTSASILHEALVDAFEAKAMRAAAEARAEAEAILGLGSEAERKGPTDG